MVLINTIKIDALGDNISIDVSTKVGNTFTKVSLWTKDTYKVVLDAIDLTSKLVGTSETENFTIQPSDIGLAATDKFKGVFFLEFTTDEIEDNVALGYTSNFIEYHLCILNDLLAIESVDCNGAVMSGCTSCIEMTNYKNLLLENTYTALLNGFIEEGILMLKHLDTLCGICNNCPSYETPALINGLGLQTSDNNIIYV